ncbi:DMT family transporter [Shewanella sp. JM162201]|uniref:DMT family transporter n=1 Tax=Shewanella jiangmenensis TaxID=2837387 RepID=A0ABS5V352_9GAMM|nr:DMT family transporter [Shewanella jiangmenensis]MBT1444383.1 DMT family transporter [Shewanella jiangmenensis]
MNKKPEIASTQDNSRLWLLTALTMLAFAANSLLCREALVSGSIDAASFTLVRMVSGALVLMMLAFLQSRTAPVPEPKPDPKQEPRPVRLTGNWRSALALLGYAAAFSFAYHSLTAATGALLLFGAVQATMIGYGLWSGERPNRLQLFGMLLALLGLGWFLLPGVAAPDSVGALLMLLAGVCWGVYSLLGRGAASPLSATAGNFVRSVPLALLLYGVIAAVGIDSHGEIAGQGGGGEIFSVSAIGVLYGIGSGAIASGLGYALWYAVLPRIEATTAATVQLSVPIIAAFGGLLLLGEPLSLRLILCSTAVLGGIALAVLNRPGK